MAAAEDVIEFHLQPVFADTDPFVYEMFRICFIKSERKFGLARSRYGGRHLCRGENLERALLRHFNKLENHELLKHYRKVCQRVGIPYLLAMRTPIPYFDFDHFNLFLKDEPLSWSAVGAIIFTAIRLTMVYMDLSKTDGCLSFMIARVVKYLYGNLLAAIFDLGGWEQFCRALVGEGASGIDILPYVNRFDEHWRLTLPRV